jgi:hypothetical protein
MKESSGGGATILVEAETRAVNATAGNPCPTMAQKRCSRCSFWFAVPVTVAEALPKSDLLDTNTARSRV